jgi:hypothetical protein
MLPDRAIITLIIEVFQECQARKQNCVGEQCIPAPSAQKYILQHLIVSKSVFGGKKVATYARVFD